MRVEDLLESHEDIEEWKASRKLCKSKRSDKSLGASALASCRAQGLRSRKNKRRMKIKGKIRSLQGKKIKSDDYGGPVNDYKYVYHRGKRKKYR